MAGFIQIIEWSSSRIDEVRALGEARRSEMGGEDGPARITVTANRGTPGRYMTVVEFASYEQAMRNSERPETSAFAQEMAKLCDGPPTFYDLDVVEEHVLAGGAPATTNA